MPRYLGLHPEFLKFEQSFRRMPGRYPGHSKELAKNNALYLWAEPTDLLDIFDEDMRQMVQGYLIMNKNIEQNSYVNTCYDEDEVRKARISESCFAQPYILWLLGIARLVAPHFADRLTSCFSGEGFEYSPAPVKGFIRCEEKVREK